MDWRHSTHCGGGECVEVTYDWRKSSYSGNGDSNCVEVAWHTSSRSAGNGACVEVAWRRSTRCESGRCVEVAAGSPVLVRDSKLGDDSPILEFAPQSWQEFIAGISADRLTAG